MTERTTFTWDGETVSAALHHPAGDAIATLVLAHGAGGSVATPQLARIGDALAVRGVGVVRFNFPYAERGRRTPGSPKESVACYQAVATAVASERGSVLLGGKSYGGRMASLLVAEGFEAAGLVFFGYPLHAPGKTEALRDAHLRGIRIPMLFLQGTRDAFARLDLIKVTAATLARAHLHVVEGADHSFAVPGRPAADVIDELAGAVAAWAVTG